MNPILKKAHADLQAMIAESNAIQSADAPTEEQIERAKALPALMQAKRDEIQQLVAFQKATDDANQFLNGTSIASVASAAVPSVTAEDAKEYDQVKKLRARAKFFGLVCEDRQRAQAMAYDFGMMLTAALKKDPRAVQYCRERGILATVHSEGDNESGGALVVPEFENALIDLREVFGKFRQFARYTPMASDTKSRPRRTGGLTAYHVGSQEAAAASKAGWDRVQLVAKKVMVLAKYESELGEDAMVDFGDTMAGEIAYAFSVREDSDGFVGDGTSTYGGIVGATQKLLNVYGTGGGLGLVLGAGNAWSELTLGNFQTVKGALPEYVEERGDIAWYCSKPFWETVMAPLALAAGGVTAAEIVAGVRRQFLGYPVRITQSMAKTQANSQVPVLLGALELAADFGDRRRTTIAFSEHEEFSEDNIVAKGTERYDINVHDAGDATNAGPIVGLLTASA
jgi:HK97 family phage major capsid protein